MSSPKDNLTPDLGENLPAAKTAAKISRQITMRVPQNHHNEPIISRLVSEHGLTVNIVAAILGQKNTDEGWFNLDLEGTDSQIHGALEYLHKLGLEIWDKSNADEESIW